jgi:DHA1 family multidrug resistance protein-like MFS transporter
MSKTPVLPLFAESLGASPEIIGFIAAAATVVGILTSAPAGILSDHFGRRKILLFAGIVFASAPFLYYWIHSPAQLAALRLYHGLATAVFGPVALALVADLFPSGRAQKMGTFSSVTLGGRFLAPLLGGFLIYRFGYRSVYLFCAVFGVIALVLLFRIPDHQADNRQVRKMDVSFREMTTQIRSLFGNVPLLGTSISEAAVYFAFGAIETFFPLYAVKVGIDARGIGLLFSMQILTIAFTKPFMGKMSDRYGRKAPIVIGLAAGAFVVALVPVFHHILLLGAILIVFGLAMATVTASTAALAADLSTRSAHGSSMGMLSSIMDIGHASGPVVTGFLVLAWGYNSAFLFASLIMLLPIVLFPLLVRIPEHELE